MMTPTNTPTKNVRKIIAYVTICGVLSHSINCVIILSLSYGRFTLYWKRLLIRRMPTGRAAFNGAAPFIGGGAGLHSGLLK